MTRSHVPGLFFSQSERAFGSWEDAEPSNAPCEWPQPIASTREGARFARLDRTELQLIYGDLDPFITIALDGPSLESEDYLPFVVLSEVLQHRAQGSVKRLRHAGSVLQRHRSHDGLLGAAGLAVRAELPVTRPRSLCG